MHTDEIAVPPDLVRRLVDGQFPVWSGLPMERVDSAGTDNALYRLGDVLSVRLPRIHWAAGQPAKEYAWLPKLAPHLPLEIPVPLALGEPAYGYPYQWSVVRWIDGRNALSRPVADPLETARALAGFLRALQTIETAGAPRPDAFNAGRGAPLAPRNAEVQHSATQLRSHPDPMTDVAAALSVWEDALLASPYAGEGAWLHGDIHATNVLVREGRLAAIIDWGSMGVGDPACDLLPAWLLFDAPARRLFLDEMNVDDATLRRGRGWAVSMALNILPYYRHTNPTLVAMAQRAIDEVLLDL